MTDRFQTDAFDAEPLDSFDPRPRETPRRHPALPAFLARRLLRAGEEIAWVRGPWFNPSWERYVTHPALFLVALVLAALCMGIGWLTAESWAHIQVGPVLAAAGLVFGSIAVLGFCCGYFTRLVVTNFRIVIIQGRDACRSWAVDDLPPSLTRYRRRSGGDSSRTIDLDAVKTMLGGASDQFADAKTILAFGKQLGHIKAREEEENRGRESY